MCGSGVRIGVTITTTMHLQMVVLGWKRVMELVKVAQGGVVRAVSIPKSVAQLIALLMSPMREANI
jgi:hypothetical protein